MADDDAGQRDADRRRFAADAGARLSRGRADTVEFFADVQRHILEREAVEPTGRGARSTILAIVSELVAACAAHGYPLDTAQRGAVYQQAARWLDTEEGIQQAHTLLSQADRMVDEAATARLTALVEGRRGDAVVTDRVAEDIHRYARRRGLIDVLAAGAIAWAHTPPYHAYRAACDGLAALVADGDERTSAVALRWALSADVTEAAVGVSLVAPSLRDRYLDLLADAAAGWLEGADQAPPAAHADSAAPAATAATTVVEAFAAAGLLEEAVAAASQPRIAELADRVRAGHTSFARACDAVFELADQIGTSARGRSHRPVHEAVLRRLVAAIDQRYLLVDADAVAVAQARAAWLADAPRRRAARDGALSYELAVAPGLSQPTANWRLQRLVDGGHPDIGELTAAETARVRQLADRLDLPVAAPPPLPSNRDA